MKSLIYCLSLMTVVAFINLSAQKTHAAGITITKIYGASAVNLGDGTNSIAYGGIMGSVTNGDCGTTTSSTNTCSNCVYLSGFACNLTRIHGSLYLTIEFTITAELSTATALHIGYTTNGESTPNEFSSGEAIYSGSHSQSAVIKGSTGSVKILWSTICGYAPDISDSNCEDPTIDISTFRIFFGLESSGDNYPTSQRGVVAVEFPTENYGDEDSIDCTGVGSSPGFCEFIAKPGDEKVKIDDIVPNGSCTSTIKALRMFYSPDGFTQATYGGTHSDIPLDSSCSPESDGTITDLTNYTPLFFRISVVDVANNNFYLADPVTDIPAVNALCGAVGTPPTPAEDFACDYIATPGLVEGLLPEDLNCFIATAAYGSPFAKNIADLRSFRDQFLKPFRLGRAFIRYYYQEGPKAAAYIANKESLRRVVRVALFPIWGFAWLSLHYGIFGSSLLLIAFIIMAIISLRQWRRGDT